MDQCIYEEEIKSCQKSVLNKIVACLAAEHGTWFGHKGPKKTHLDYFSNADQVWS